MLGGGAGEPAIACLGEGGIAFPGAILGEAGGGPNLWLCWPVGENGGGGDIMRPRTCNEGGEGYGRPTAIILGGGGEGTGAGGRCLY